jgi:phage gp36-like protein
MQTLEILLQNCCNINLYYLLAILTIPKILPSNHKNIEYYNKIDL